MTLPLCRLYLITPPRLDDLAGFGRTLAHALDAGDVAALQIRLKDVSGRGHRQPRLSTCAHADRRALATWR